MLRKDYLAGDGSEALHRTYYAQFVDSDILDLVKVRVGKAVICASTDDNFNDIPLSRWERLAPTVWALCRYKFVEYGDTASLNGALCVCKEAAKQIKEAHGP